MKDQPRGSPVEELVRQIRDATGNLVSPSRLHFLEEAAGRRARALGIAGLAAYVHSLAAGELEAEWGFLVALVTIKESYFYRAPQQFEAIRRAVLPGLLRARAGERRLRIWSAACARGEEPATLALQLAEDPSLAGWDWTIVATDLDAEALAGARSGLYGERAVAQVPPDLLARWFVPRGKLFELSPDLRERIHFLPLNLALPPYKLPAAPFDLILLRNVLIYFRRSLQRKVVAEVERQLAPDGSLFLGATETLWPAPGRLVPVELEGCFVYRHGPTPGAPEPAGLASRAEAERSAGALTGPPSPAPAEPASAGALSLEPRGGLLAAPAASEAPGARASGNQAVFEPALNVALRPAPLAEPPPGERPATLDAAVVLLAEDRLDEAAALLAAILTQTPSDPEAHAVQGFLLDVRGGGAAAIASYRAALYLDPGLFQVRLLLAECHLRRREPEAAERQFREVLTLLATGRGRPLAAFAPLPVPDRERAERRSRQALGGR